MKQWRQQQPATTSPQFANEAQPSWDDWYSEPNPKRQAVQGTSLCDRLLHLLNQCKEQKCTDSQVEAKVCRMLETRGPANQQHSNTGWWNWEAAYPNTWYGGWHADYSFGCGRPASQNAASSARTGRKQPIPDDPGEQLSIAPGDWANAPKCIEPGKALAAIESLVKATLDDACMKLRRPRSHCFFGKAGPTTWELPSVKMSSLSLEPWRWS